MSKLILITGDLASGKSSLADNLSSFLNISAFKKDIIKEKYCDMYGYQTREENRKLSVMAVDYMTDAFKRFAKSNQDIILEANFRESELLNIKDIASQYNVEVILFVLRADIEILYKRFLARVPTRHRAHMSMHLDESIDKFNAYIEEQRSENVVFLPHIIDSSCKTTEEILNIVLGIIG